MSERDKIKAAVTAAAWPERVDCPNCHGDGTVNGTRKVISRKGIFTSADCDLDEVLRDIDHAERVRWEPHFMGYDSEIKGADGIPWRFAVKAPSEPSDV